MSDGIKPAGKPTDDDEAARGQFPAKTLRHLRAVEGWPARPDDAEAGEIQNLRITANVEQDRRVVDLQERLRIFGLGPVQESAARNFLHARQFLLGALERFLLYDGLGDLRWEMA